MEADMKITEVTHRTPDLLNRLLEVWEGSVRATHLFLSEGETIRIREYVPQALKGIEHLLIAENEAGLPVAFMGMRTARWKCCSSPRRKEAKGWESACSNAGWKAMPWSDWP